MKAGKRVVGISREDGGNLVVQTAAGAAGKNFVYGSIGGQMRETAVYDRLPFGNVTVGIKPGACFDGQENIGKSKQRSNDLRSCFTGESKVQLLVRQLHNSAVGGGDGIETNQIVEWLDVAERACACGHQAKSLRTAYPKRFDGICRNGFVGM